ncbi:hypothetical protein EsVE80_05410 [Enterococcus saigonensis]|uniref:Uncharacterized protein n=1 Tax=Enterococcus saigonensis TaxID=1805431 RepID=A0A679I635_9ENTE|nr:hypothetical protein [Enterococcus saigonensis]BCA85018.1 hypothetical protein EsVE80_05410 [Enterococcus saigonensis]
MIPKPVILDISEWQLPEAIDYGKLAKNIDGQLYGCNMGPSTEIYILKRILEN